MEPLQVNPDPLYRAVRGTTHPERKIKSEGDRGGNAEVKLFL